MVNCFSNGLYVQTKSVDGRGAWQEFRIQRIKDHLFRQHQLDYGFDLFDPDPDIADAWLRLQQGNFTY